MCTKGNHVHKPGNLNLNPFALAGLLGQQPQLPKSTPSLPQFGRLTPEQIQQLAFLQYLQNPFGGLAGLPNLAANPALNPVANQGQVITNSKPIVKEKTLYTTATVPLLFGNKKIFTTLTSAIGVTKVTEYEPELRTVGPGAVPNNQPQQPQLPQQLGQPQLPQLQPSFTVTSRPVVEQTTVS